MSWKLPHFVLMNPNHKYKQLVWCYIRRYIHYRKRKINPAPATQCVCPPPTDPDECNRIIESLNRTGFPQRRQPSSAKWILFVSAETAPSRKWENAREACYSKCVNFLLRKLLLIGPRSNVPVNIQPANNVSFEFAPPKQDSSGKTKAGNRQARRNSIAVSF